MAIKQTYGGRRRIHPYASSASSSSTSSSPTRNNNSENIPRVPKQSQEHYRTEPNSSLKRTQLSRSRKKLAQLHFDFVSSVKTCHLCNLSYTIGSLDDERLHTMYCSKVTKGLQWGKEEEREASRNSSYTVCEPTCHVGWPSHRGRIIALDASCGGKIGSKLKTMLSTIDVSLSAPTLPSQVLEKSKIYIFLLKSQNSASERIVGAAVMTRIESAMRIAQVFEGKDATDLLSVDGGLFCHREKLPSAMGVARLFVVISHRRRGIASALLTSAAANFIHGCPLSASRGQIAFSQPTAAGKLVMESWGKGEVLIYEE